MKVQYVGEMILDSFLNNDIDCRCINDMIEVVIHVKYDSIEEHKKNIQEYVENSLSIKEEHYTVSVDIDNLVVVARFERDYDAERDYRVGFVYKDYINDEIASSILNNIELKENRGIADRALIEVEIGFYREKYIFENIDEIIRHMKNLRYYNKEADFQYDIIVIGYNNNKLEIIIKNKQDNCKQI